jgi:hypothetical protein
VSEEADESVFWLKRMLNADIRSTTAALESLLAEAEELARIFGASAPNGKAPSQTQGRRQMIKRSTASNGSIFDAPMTSMMIQ